MYARLGFLGAVVLAAVLAACGGGGGGSSNCCPPPTVPPTSTPTNSPPAPTQSVALGSSAQSVALPVAAGAAYSGTIAVPAGSGSVVFAASTSAPSNAPVLDVVHWRRPASTSRPAVAAPPYSTAAYITLTANSATTLSGNLTFTVSPSGTYYVAQYNAQGFWVTLGVTNSQFVAVIPASLAANATEYFAVYSGGALPSPNPDGCVGVQPDLRARNATAQTQAIGAQPFGGQYNYVGNLAETISRATPCAIPTSSSAAAVSVAVTFAPATPGVRVYENSTETDAYSTETVTTTTSALIGEAIIGAAGGVGQGFVEFNETTSDEVGDSVVTAYSGSSPAPVIAVYSPQPDPTSYANSPPSMVVTTLADGSSMTRTYSGSPGSYTETDTIPGISGTNNIVNNGSSGSYTIQTPNFAGGGVASLVFTYAAPANNTITVTEKSGTTTLSSLTYPAWFSTSQPFYSDTLAGGASAVATPLPSPCQSAYVGVAGGTFYPFTRTTTVVDAVLGYSDNRTVTSYVAKNFNNSGHVVGPVCVSISDVENIFYDYFLDTPASLFVSATGAPLQTDTITEAYWFDPSHPPSGYSSARSERSIQANVPGLAASIAAHEAAISFRRSMQRAARMENFVRNVATHVGGVK